MTHLTRKDKLIPWYFVFFFITLMIVDGVMVTLAIKTNSGLVTDHPYEKGLAYNQVVGAKNKQDELGWRSTASWDGKYLNIQLYDKDNTVLQPDKIQVFFTRPTTLGMDFRVDLLQTAGKVDFPANGVWDARIFVTYQEKTYQQSKRLIVE